MDQSKFLNAREFLDSLDGPSKDRLESLYVLQVLAYVSAVGVLGLGMACDLPARLVFAHHKAHYSDAVFFFPASTLILTIPLVLGIPGVVGPLTKWFGGVLAGPFKDKWIELQQVGDMGKAGSAIIGFCFAIGVAAVLSMFLFADCYAKVTASGIITNDLFALEEKQHSWSDITSISRDIHLNRRYGRVAYRVRFTDGSSWELAQGDFYNVCDQSVKGCMQYISEKAGKKIQHGSVVGN